LINSSEEDDNIKDQLPLSLAGPEKMAFDEQVQEREQRRKKQDREQLQHVEDAYRKLGRK
jgi:hypothetical protein